MTTETAAAETTEQTAAAAEDPDADTSSGSAVAPARAGRVRGTNRIRAWVVPALVLVLLDAGGLAWWQHRGTAAPAAAAVATTRTTAVVASTLKQTVAASGTLTPTVDQTFGFAVSGVVNSVEVKAGQRVKQGQVLATIARPALRAALAQARATLATDRATLAADEAATASSTTIAADNAVITAAAADVTTAAANLADGVLKAPVAGLITTFDLAVGDTVTGTGSGTGSGSSSSTAGTTGSRSTAGTGTGTGTGSTSSSTTTSTTSGSSVEIVGTSSWQVATTVDDTDIGKLAVGDQATISLTLSSASSSTGTTTGGFAGGGFAGGGFGGFGGAGAGGATGTGTGTGTGTAATTTVYGTVTSIGLVPSTTTGVAAYPVVVTVTGTSSDLYDGMSATTSIVYRQLTDVLAVPTAAITTSGSTHTVQVSLNGKTTIRTVQTGAVVGTQTQIVSGLTSGQDVVVPSVRGLTGTGTGGAAGGTTGRAGRTGGFGGGAGTGG